MRFPRRVSWTSTGPRALAVCSLVALAMFGVCGMPIEPAKGQGVVGSGDFRLELHTCAPSTQLQWPQTNDPVTLSLHTRTWFNWNGVWLPVEKSRALVLDGVGRTANNTDTVRLSWPQGLDAAGFLVGLRLDKVGNDAFCVDSIRLLHKQNVLFTWSSSQTQSAGKYLPAHPLTGPIVLDDETRDAPASYVRFNNDSASSSSAVSAVEGMIEMRLCSPVSASTKVFVEVNHDGMSESFLVPGSVVSRPNVSWILPFRRIQPVNQIRSITVRPSAPICVSYLYLHDGVLDPLSAPIPRFGSPLALTWHDDTDRNIAGNEAYSYSPSHVTFCAKFGSCAKSRVGYRFDLKSVNAWCASGSGPQAADDTCNGLDEDCDGVSDDNFVAPWRTCGGPGVCTTSAPDGCSEGIQYPQCGGGPTGADNDCNGADDDCDAKTDEGYASVATSCGKGVCAASGRTSCVSGQVQDSCRAGTPSTEVCDALDNDCDGQSNEGLSRTQACGVGICRVTVSQSCDAAGNWVGTCVPNDHLKKPAEISANTVDDDCDGQTDERDPERCTDGYDNDGDRLVDCADALNCAKHEACRPPKPYAVEVPVGALQDVPLTSVGALPGVFSVTDHGSSSYQLPLQVPPGRAGMTPALSLSYDSNAGEGRIARGWSLAGLSVIGRCPSSFAVDGVARGVHLDDKDSYCLDGQKLAVVSRGSDSVEFRTFPDSHRRVIAHGAWGGPDSYRHTGPSWFEVFLPDGRVMRYGRTEASRVWADRRNLVTVNIHWFLDEVEDPYGNTMQVEYETLAAGRWDNVASNDLGAVAAYAGEVRPRAIRYGDSASHVVEFRYAPGDTNVNTAWYPRAYRGGVGTHVSAPLQSIHMVVQKQETHRYELRTSRKGAHVYLDSVALCTGADPEASCVPATSFDYTEPSLQAFARTVTTIDPGRFSIVRPGFPAQSRVWVFDQNNDQRQDIAVPLGRDEFPGESFPELAVLTSQGLLGAGVFKVQEQKWGPAAGVQGNVDFDGDGFSDVLLGPVFGGLAFSAHGTPNPNRYFVGLSSNASVVWPSGQAAEYLLNDPSGRYWPVDVQGDGRTELVQCIPDDGTGPSGWSSLEFRCTPSSDGTGGRCELREQFISRDVARDCEGTVMDTDGDGVASVVAFEKDKAYLIEPAGARLWAEMPFDWSRDTKHILDANGDGLVDVLTAFRGDTEMNLYLNTGAGFELSPRRTLDTVPDYIGAGTVIDIDSDGTFEVCAPDPNTTWTCTSLFGTADGQPNNFLTNIPVLRSANGSGDVLNQEPVALDVDGDGSQELLLKGGSVSEPRFEIWKGASRESGLLKSVTDGLGMTHSVTYGSGEALSIQSNLDPYPTYRAACDELFARGARPYPQRCLTMPPRPVVTSHTESGPSGYESSTLRQATAHAERVFQHAYQGAVADLHGHGWLGFEWHQVRELVGSDGRALRTQTRFLDIMPVPGFAPFAAGASFGRSFAVPRLVRESTWVETESALDPAQVTRREFRTTFDHAVLESSEHLPFLARKKVETKEIEGETSGSFPWKAKHDIYTSTTCYGHWDWSERECEPDYDPHGNLLGRVRSWRSDAPGVSHREDGRIESVYEYDIDDDLLRSWRLRLMTKESTTLHAENDSDPSPRSISVINEYNERGKLEHTERWDLSSQSSEAEAATTVLYDAHGNPAWVIETGRDVDAPRSTLTEYDELSIFPARVTKVSTLEPSTEYIHDYRHGTPRFERRADGTWTAQSFDALGRLRYTVDSEGRESRTSFGASSIGAMKISTSSDGAPSETVHVNAFGRVVEEQLTSAEGAPMSITRYAYDSQGHEIARSTPFAAGGLPLGVHRTSYDALGRITQQTAPYVQEDGSVADAVTTHEWVYRDNSKSVGGLLLWSAMKRGVAARVSYDPTCDGSTQPCGKSAVVVNSRGQTVYTVDPESQATEFAHDATGALARATTHPFFAFKRETRITNDSLGKPIRIEAPGLPVQELVNDGFGRPIEQRRRSLDPNVPDQVTTVRYDRDGRLVRRDTPDGVYVWEYDGGAAPRAGDWGKLTAESVSGAVGEATTELEYEGPGASLTEERRTIEGTTYTTKFVNDAWGRPQLIRYPEPVAGLSYAVQLHYDAYGHVQRVAEEGGGDLWRVTEVDVFGQDRVVRTRNGVDSIHARELATGRISGTEVRRGSAYVAAPEKLTYERRGLLSKHLIGLRVHRIEHDAKARLAAESVWVGDQQAEGHAYDYDRDGNLILNPTAGSLRYEDPTRPAAVTSTDSGMSFAYDAFGNQSERRGSGVAAGRLRIEYTSFDLPLLATLGEDADPNKRTLAYRYDASGARTSSTIEGGERITYVGARYRVTRTATDEIEYAALIPSPEAIETEVVLQPGGARHYRFGHANYQGSIVAVTGDQGKADEQRDWSRFGALRALSGRSGMRSGFTGHEQDSATGLINMRGRVYDAHTGRFLSADAIVQAPGLVDSWNRYSYALNRPTALVDPTGFQSREFGATARVPRGQPDPAPSGYVPFPSLKLPQLALGATAPAAPSGTPGYGVSVYDGGQVLSLDEWDDSDAICVAVDCVQLAAYERFELFADLAYFVAEQVVIGGALKATGLALKLGELGGAAYRWVAGWAGRGAAAAAAGAGAAGGGGVLEGANFAQKTFGRMFSRGGAFAGRSVDDVAAALRSGSMSPSQVPIDYIVREGNTLILNTRSAQALQAAGIPRSAWTAVNRTGQEMYEAMLTGQLQRNGLTSAGIPTVRPSGAP